MTKQPPAVPLPGPNATPEPNEKSRVWQAIVPGTQTKPQDTRVWQAIVPGTQTKPQDTLRIRKTPWHGVTKQPPAVPLSPNATPERNKKIKVLAGIPLLGHRGPLFQAQKSVHRAPKTLRAGMLAGNSTRHPSNQENTLARRDETASCRPSAGGKRHS